MFAFIMFLAGSESSFAKAAFPLCGFLTENGNRDRLLREKYKDKMVDGVFLVPRSNVRDVVARYYLVTKRDTLIEANLNWYFCIIKGKVIKEAQPEYSEMDHYGIIEVDEYSFSNQRTSERPGAE